MTVLGADRPGLVHELAELVAARGGSWGESRMARLAGQFAGIVRVDCPGEAVEALLADLESLRAGGVSVQAVLEETAEPAARRRLSLSVLGNDRPGIVRDLTASVAKAGGNIEELVTGLESAPMSGQALFRASGTVSVPEGISADAVRAAVEALSGEFAVDLIG